MNEIYVEMTGVTPVSGVTPVISDYSLVLFISDECDFTGIEVVVVDTHACSGGCHSEIR